jgi:hypothetical protein
MKPDAFTGVGGLKNCGCSRSAFTRAELIATLAALFICAAVLLPALAGSATRSEQLGCLNNLRQVGIAFQAWGNDHDDQRPWFVQADVPGNQGGTRGHPLVNDVFIHFSALSNYMSPTLLSDPGEVVRNKRVAQDWSWSPAGGFMNGAFRNNALSYMLGVHTTVGEPANILMADRNLLFSGVTGCSYGFNQVRGLDYMANFRGWTNGNHGTFGNVLLNDGRVEFTSSERLRVILRRADDFGSFEHFLAPPY